MNIRASPTSTGRHLIPFKKQIFTSTNSMMLRKGSIKFSIKYLFGNSLTHKLLYLHCSAYVIIPFSEWALQRGFSET